MRHGDKRNFSDGAEALPFMSDELRETFGSLIDLADQCITRRATTAARGGIAILLLAGFNAFDQLMLSLKEKT